MKAARKSYATARRALLDIYADEPATQQNMNTVLCLLDEIEAQLNDIDKARGNVKAEA